MLIVDGDYGDKAPEGVYSNSNAKMVTRLFAWNSKCSSAKHN